MYTYIYINVYTCIRIHISEYKCIHVHHVQISHTHTNDVHISLSPSLSLYIYIPNHGLLLHVTVCDANKCIMFHLCMSHVTRMMMINALVASRKHQGPCCIRSVCLHPAGFEVSILCSRLSHSWNSCHTY